MAQLSLGPNEEDEHQPMSRVTRALGEDVLNLDSAGGDEKHPELHLLEPVNQDFVF